MSYVMWYTRNDHELMVLGTNFVAIGSYGLQQVVKYWLSALFFFLIPFSIAR